MASLPYPRHPSRGFSGLRSTNRALVHQHCNPPTESTEHTETSGGEEPPTDFTDAHRWLGCVWFSHGIHGIHRSFWRRRASHRFHRCTQMVRLRRVLPRNSRNSQKLLAEKSLPQISQMPTDGLAAYGSPTEFTEVSGARYSPTDFTDAHRWLGCVGFCGKIIWCLRGYGRDAIPS